ncbi:MAG: alpha,alpha-trehalose-phosphate synthase (UDP-forming) [Candidatus Binatia bacterium]
MVSNRAPYSVRRRAGKTELIRTVGGLASTLDDALRSRGGMWLAWSGNVSYARGRGRDGTSTHAIRAPGGGYRLRLLNLTEQQVTEFYHGFSNRTLWPLCHYFVVRSRFDEDDWRSYEAVNRLFAKAAARMVPANGLVWIHDFQLSLVPAMLRSLRRGARIAMFWHIPFPPSAVFRVNPWAREIVRGMLGSDLIGFHTEEYARHFLECARDILGIDVDLGRGEARHGGRTIRVSAFPLGIEGRTFAHLGADRRTVAAAEQLRRTIGIEKLILGVDRLDYTKGILERLEAYEQVLAESPEFHRKISFLQIQVPSRENVPEYRALREQIDRTVGRILGRFSSPGWTPLRYLCRGFGRRELAVYYRAADVMLVTALRDGMNLVAQEFVATRADNDGELILSEFAGAADRLREACLVNPYARAATARAIREALHMKAGARHAAMRAMRRRVLTEDVDWWLGWFLAAAAAPLRRKVPRPRRRASA